MYSISKTTVNFAKARGLELEVNGSMLEVSEADNDSEFMFSLRMMGDSFFYNGNVYLPEAIKEELPAYMKDEKALRAMLKFVAGQRAA
ncbi:hypothetical protein HBO38_35010 [Pseudomonas veronii]|uniref:Uncharacterized protein n=2 Tax=Pseudomonas veronii TaxID=76761 RepID=A0A7Y1FCP8_PSEVE|nr:hypothetical protein [Pseudomonas veronii]